MLENISFSSNKTSKKDIKELYEEIKQLSNKLALNENTYNEIESKTIRLLNNNGLEVGNLDSDETLAHLAFKSENLDLIKLICQSYMTVLGANDTYFNWLLKENNERMTVLDIVSEKGNKELIKYLYSIISKTTESKLRIMEGRNNLFHYAAKNNHCFPIIFFYERLQTLFKDTFIIDIPGEKQMTPFLCACETKSFYTIDLLLNFGVNINAQDSLGNTALHYAVKNNSTKMIRKLLINGASKSIKNKENQTPYDLAKELNKNNIIKELENIPCAKKAFCAQREVKGIEGYKNNLLLLYIVFLFLFVKFVYGYRFLTLHFNDEIKKEFLPFIKSVNYENLISEYKDKTQLYDKCLLNSNSDICTAEVSFIIVSLVIDIILMAFAINFLFYSKNIYLRKNKNLRLQSLSILFEENRRICVKCGIPIDRTTVHCIICNSCVKNFHHHCYWLNTCINKENLCKFNLFIFTLFISLIFNLINFTINAIHAFNKSIIKENFIQVVIGLKYQKSTCDLIIYFWGACHVLLIGITIYGMFFVLIPYLISINKQKEKYNERITLNFGVKEEFLIPENDNNKLNI